MNLKEQIYVCTLARCGTITKAAEELYMTSPALSMFLSTLEKNLGVRLFSRTGKTLQPTPIGREYIRYAEQMIQLKEQFDQVLAREIGLQKCTVRIGIQQRRAIFCAAWVMSHLTEDIPSLNVVIRDGAYAELNKMLEQHQADYLFYTMEDPIPDTEYVVLQKEPILAVLPEDHPCNALAKHRPDLDYPYLDPADLNGQPLILPQVHQSLRLRVQRMLDANHVRPARVMEIVSLSVIQSMVANGLGIGFNRRAYLRDMPHAEGIRYYYVGEEPACSDLVLLFPTRQKKAPYHDRLIEIFREYLAECPEGAPLKLS